MSMRTFTSKALNAYGQLFHRNFAPLYIPTILYKDGLETHIGFCFRKTASLGLVVL